MLVLYKFCFSKEKNLFRYLWNTFRIIPKSISFYKVALTHKSSEQKDTQGHRINNERLEFLGDAVLGSVVAEYLFKKFPFAEEGLLTDMRSKIVCRESLNKIAQQIELDKQLIVNEKQHMQYQFIKGNTFEAIIGAIYLDKGYKTTKRILYKLILKNFDEKALNEVKNFKGLLLSWAQQKQKHVELKLVQTVGEGYGKQFVVHLFINDEFKAEGQGSSIKKAEQQACQKVYTTLFC